MGFYFPEWNAHKIMSNSRVDFKKKRSLVLMGWRERGYSHGCNVGEPYLPPVAARESRAAHPLAATGRPTYGFSFLLFFRAGPLMIFLFSFFFISFFFSFLFFPFSFLFSFLFLLCFFIFLFRLLFLLSYDFENILEMFKTKNSLDFGNVQK